MSYYSCGSDMHATVSCITCVCARENLCQGFCAKRLLVVWHGKRGKDAIDQKFAQLRKEKRLMTVCRVCWACDIFARKGFVNRRQTLSGVPGRKS